MRPTTKYLIVNADDFGYFTCVSRGILDLASEGALGATGIMANSTDFDMNVNALAVIDTLDLGVHLNITYGKPLTENMGRLVSQWDGNFPGKYHIVLNVLSGKISIADIKEEWRAQIRRCLDSGIAISFLNSHEHIHMLPPLYRTTQELAQEFAIRHIRYTTAEWCWPPDAGSVVRNIVMQTCNAMNHAPQGRVPVKLLGLKESGEISIKYLEHALSKLSPGKVYELMCHPGYFDPLEIDDPALLSYHNWEHEHKLLGSSKLMDLYQQYNVQLVGYRDLAPG